MLLRESSYNHYSRATRNSSSPPSVQTALADLFIEAIQSREDGHDRSIQLIIESHFPRHFLRRLQRLVAEQILNPDDVALYFCHTSDQGAILSPLEVDLYGEILNWPEDFFGDEIGSSLRPAWRPQRSAKLRRNETARSQNSGSEHERSSRCKPKK